MADNPAVNDYASSIILSIPQRSYMHLSSSFRFSRLCFIGFPVSSCPFGLKQQTKPQHGNPVLVARLGMWLVTLLILGPPRRADKQSALC